MKKTLITILIVAALTITATSFAAENSNVRWTYTADLFNKYVASTSGINSHDEDVAQTSITAFHVPSGWYANIWGCAATKRPFDKDNDWASETDFTLGKEGKFAGLDYDARLAYWMLADIGNLEDADTLYGSFELSKTYDDLKLFGRDLAITPYAKFNIYTILSGEKWDGILVNGGIRSNLKINDFLSLQLGGMLAYHDGIFGVKKDYIYKIDGGLSWKLRENLTLRAPNISYYVPFGNNSNRDNELVIGTGLTFSF